MSVAGSEFASGAGAGDSLSPRALRQARINRVYARRANQWWPPLAVLAVLVGLWYLVANYYASQQLAFLVPYPHLVVKAAFADPLFTPQLVADLGNSTQVALTGLVIAIVIGVVWATLMAQAKWVERSLFPYAVILQCIPILALVPLIGALFGYEFLSRVIVTVMISIFPMVSNTLFGLQSTDLAQRELFKLQGASKWTTLTKLQFPAALPSIFVGLRNAAGLSVIGAIVGDQFFQRGTPGLGVLIQVSTSRLNGAGTYAAILTASLLGVAVFLLFGWLSRLAIGKWYDFG
ncbi:ABC transporter permease [Lacisediminihabitans sp. H27-G8]|uniref:ABC transporter permease n=1 Tax=Lacisediminihabitans sp. H27-G8 TaxID=3111909 RepID=UPI0038FCAB63